MTDQTARIAEALLDHLSRTADIRPGRNGDPAFMPEITDGERMRIAEHLAAVLPATVDRAAVLAEIEQAVRTVTSNCAYGADAGCDFCNGVDAALTRVRRLAGEAQQAPCGRSSAIPTPCSAGDHCCTGPSEARQDPTQDGETEAHPPLNAWRVETRDPLADEWAPGSQFASRPHAVERYETANRIAPLWRDGTPVERRIVRETTTYTVEESTAVARPGQPETDGEPADTAQQPKEA